MMQRTITACILGLALATAGCSGDDPTAPPDDCLLLDAAAAEQWTVSALEMLNGVTTAVPDLATGDFSTWNTIETAKSAEAPTWDPDQMAYVYDFAGPLVELEAPNHWLVAIALWVQYRDAQGPVQYPLGADEMELAVEYGMDMHIEEEGSVSDLQYTHAANMVVTDIGSGDTYGVTGTGTTVVEVSNVTPELNESGRFTMTWTLDLTVAAEGCPAGTATMQVQDWILAAVYDGAGSVTWTLTGPAYQGEGVATVVCGTAL